MGPQRPTPPERAQSEVIGVVLMVAVVVILASVVGAFALGIGQVAETEVPQAGFVFDYDASANELTITHESGDVLDRAAVDVVGDKGGVDPDPGWPDSEIEAGDQFVADNVQSDETVRVVWVDEASGTSATLGTWTGPDA